MKAEKNIAKQLTALTERLTDKKIEFAICGGLAGGLYRSELRLTTDIDVMVAETELSKFKSILKDFGLVCVEVREAELIGGPLFAIKNKSTPIQILVGRDNKEKDVIGIDFLLPTIPWVKIAVERAQHNIVKFGSVFLPTITLEDFIVAKLFAMKIKTPRFKDLDDLEQVFKANLNMDFIYLSSQLEDLELKIPEVLADFVPERLGIFIKGKKSRKT